MNSTRTILILSIIFACIGWAVYAFLLWNTSSKNDDLYELARELKIQEERQRQISSAASLLSVSEGKIGRIENIFLGSEDSDVVEFLQEIEDLRTGMNIELDITSLEERNIGGLPFLAARIDMRGQWKEVFNFIRLVENMPYSIDGQSITLREEFIEDGGGYLWDASLRILILQR